jgi:hypothetical protein
MRDACRKIYRSDTRVSLLRFGGVLQQSAQKSIGGLTTRCQNCSRNSLVQSSEMQLHARRKWIKIGKLHSQNAILKREQEWQKDWSFLVQYSAGALDELSSDDNHEAVSSEHNCR